MKDSTMYVIVLEKFNHDAQNLYYNAELDTWAQSLKFATKFSNRNLAQVVTSVLCMKNYCHLEEVNTYTVFAYEGEDIKDETQFNNRDEAITYARATGADEVVCDWTGEVIYKK